MVNSMTAFARAQASSGGFVLTWELRSVNHRFLEMQFRLPEALRSAEYPLRDTLRKHLKRGKLDCSLRMERQASESTIELNRPLLLQVLGMVEQVRRDAPEIGSPNPMDLLRWPGVIGDDAGFDDETLATAVTDLFDEALTSLYQGVVNFSSPATHVQATWQDSIRGAAAINAGLHGFPQRVDLIVDIVFNF